jgi:hypothetical protein
MCRMTQVSPDRIDIPSERDQLLDLKHQYCQAFDAGDLETLMTLFTGDARCDMGRFGTWTGTSEIREGYIGQIARTGVPGTRVHAVSNPLLKLSSDTATGTWALVSFDLTRVGMSPVGVIGRYQDSYRRENGSWLISETRLEVAWSAG